MKRTIHIALVAALFLASCGLKVPVSLTGSEQEQSGLVRDDGAGRSGIKVAPSLTGPATGTDGSTGTTTTGPGVAAGSFFSSETEGITKDQIRLCAHVPITGAAPIPHHPDRFGQFYFNYVNAELGGVFGRKVIFRAINDNYNPAGARNAMEQCAKIGAFMYLGAAGTDQIVSVARWAERRRVPYVHGPTSDRDLGGLHYNVHAGPTYEYQHELLARYLVNRFGKSARYQTIKVDSPYFDAGAKAFRDELLRLGVTMPGDIKVQKDESQFQSVFFELQQRGITVINNFTTPNIWIKMLAQSATYDGWWSAVSPVAGFNIVAQALSEANAKAVVFHHFGPACECTTYKDEEISQHKDLPWYDDIKEFLRVFKRYSPEQDPPPDDFDYASYLSAKATHRFLLQLGPSPTRTKLWKLFTTYKEVPSKTFPGCAGDFTRNKLRMGAWRVNVLELTYEPHGVWKQIASCIDRV